jgi:hypothetical protein
MFKRRPRPPKMTREQSLAMKPMQLVDGELNVDAAGNGKLSVPIRPTRVARWLVKNAEGRRKTFELDPVGVYVWKQIDGKTSVEALIRRIAKQYTLDLRQAEASTTAFLKTLMQKGLIGIPVGQRTESGQ